MEKRNRTQLVLGVILILVAGWLIATRVNPDLAKIIRLPAFDWPMWVVFSGAVLLVIGLLVGAPGMAVPACIVAGIGGILYYQNATGNWESWAYMWTLIPGFVGVGSILAGILGEDFKSSVRHGLEFSDRQCHPVCHLRHLLPCLEHLRSLQHLCTDRFALPGWHLADRARFSAPLIIVKENPMRLRGSLFWGIVLIVLAALLLFSQQGWLKGDIFGYFWPAVSSCLGSGC